MAVAQQGPQVSSFPTCDLEAIFVTCLFTGLDFRLLTIYYGYIVHSYNPHLGQVLRQQRLQLSLTLHDLALKSKTSASHLGRIERGERSPSAHVLRRIAGPQGFEEQELFVLAGFLGQSFPKMADDNPLNGSRRLDPYVTDVLAREPLEVQRTAILIVTILKSLAENLRRR